MSIVSSQEMHTRSGTLTEDSEEYVRTFIVITDDPLDTPVTVGNATGIHKYDAYPGVPYCQVKNVSVTCTSEDGCQWLVSYTYGQLSSEDPDNPLAEPVEVSWSLAQFQTPVDYDLYGSAILNSAGRPFAEAVMKDDSRPVLSISRNEAYFNSPLAYQYRDTVNSTTFYNCPPGTVKVSSISAQSQYHKTIGTYYKVSYEFHFNVMGWDAVLLDQGFEEYDPLSENDLGTHGDWVKISDENVPVSAPVPLNGMGRRLPKNGQPYWHYYRIYPRLPFTVFNF